MKITVYLGACEGTDATLGAAVDAFGTWIGKNGHTLVYGGSKCGLMGRIAVSAMQAGGKAIGVEPKFFVDSELQLDGLDELIVTEDMPTRKKKMIELGDAFVAFPGGTGTLEEISEIMSAVSLKMLDAPCILYNRGGYYEGLKAQLAAMRAAGLSNTERQKGIYFCDTLEEIETLLSR